MRPLEARRALRDFIESMNDEQVALMERFEEVVSDAPDPIRGLNEFLSGLDAADKARLNAIGMAAFQRYLPKLDYRIVRAIAATFINNAINDLCNRG